MNITDVVAAWDRADPAAIHPTRRRSEAAYWESGQAQATDIAQVLKPGCRVVDFGCGDGRVTIPLSGLGFEVTGADASPAMRDRLHERAPDLTLVSTDGSDLYEQLGRKTDALVCLSVLIHHSYEDCLTIMGGLVAAVRKGGLLVLDWPVSDQPAERHNWIGVTTWDAADRAAAAEKLGIRPVDSDLPWSVWRAGGR